MAEHVTLQAAQFDRAYRSLGRTATDERWREMIELVRYDLDRPIEEYLDGPLIPLAGGQRTLSGSTAATPVFLACLAECAVERNRSQLTEHLWSDLLDATWGALGPLWLSLGGDGSPGALTYKGLLATVGLGGGTLAALPWWIGDPRHQTGAYQKARTVGMLSPGAVRALVKSARANRVLEVVRAFFTEQSADPAAAPQLIEEHERLLGFLESASLRGDWVLGME